MNNENKTNLADNITDAVEDLKEYVDLRMQLIRLNITEKISFVLANLLSTGAAVIFLILFFIFGSFALSYALGNLLDNTAAGFGVIAGVYLLTAIIILWVSKRSLRNNLVDKFIKDFSNDDNE